MATKTTNEFLGTGRRKTAIARVRLATGSGKITVNGRAFEAYFPLDTQRATVSSPLTLTSTADKLDVRVNVVGGGPLGQAGATRHGIARFRFYRSRGEWQLYWMRQDLRWPQTSTFTLIVCSSPSISSEIRLNFVRSS